MANTKADVLGKPLTGWRLQFYTVIFEADTRAGRRFDQALIGIILACVRHPTHSHHHHHAHLPGMPGRRPHA